jgi:rhodanese-related sulfurtransferase
MQSELYVEPLEIIKGLEDAVLVDVRPESEYEKSHIIDAQHLEVNIDPQTGKIQNTKEILTQIQKMNGAHDTVILYGENEYSPLPAQVAAYLAQKGMKVKLLSAGWNEFRHFSTFWIPEKINGRVDTSDYLEGAEIIRTD